jgi:hypothetical protein
MIWMDRANGRVCADLGGYAVLIAALPPGTTELYVHPVVYEGRHLFKADLATLPNARVGRSLRKRQIDSRRPGRSTRERAG